jgi:hypothetical protein
MKNVAATNGHSVIRADFVGDADALKPELFSFELERWVVDNSDSRKPQRRQPAARAELEILVWVQALWVGGKLRHALPREKYFATVEREPK